MTKASSSTSSAKPKRFNGVRFDPTRAEGTEPQKRVRASEHALKTAIKAMQDCGLTIDRISINGGRIEIHCALGGDQEPEEDDHGLKDW